jgi:hypothetical protein
VVEGGGKTLGTKTNLETLESRASRELYLLRAESCRINSGCSVCTSASVTYKPGKSLVPGDCAAYLVAYLHTPVSMSSIHCVRMPSLGDST